MPSTPLRFSRKLRALCVGIAVGAVTAGVAFGQSADDEPPAQPPGAQSTPTAPGDLRGPNAEPYDQKPQPLHYAHIGHVPASSSVVDDCRSTVTDDSTSAAAMLECEALIAASKGRLAPGDYSESELRSAVAAADK
jgi:hypothetical protein